MKSKYRLSIAVVGMMLLFAGMAFADNCSEPGSILRVSKSRIGSYEYVVFRVMMPPDPAYTVTTASPPFTEDPSGNPVSIPGPSYKSVKFTGVNWMCTIPQYFSPTRTVRRVRKISQFEGQVEYIIGYRPGWKYAGNYTYDVGSVRRVVVRFRH